MTFGDKQVCDNVHEMENYKPVCKKYFDHLLKYGNQFKYPDNMMTGGSLGEHQINMDASIAIHQNVN